MNGGIRPLSRRGFVHAGIIVVLAPILAACSNGASTTAPTQATAAASSAPTTAAAAATAPAAAPTTAQPTTAPKPAATAAPTGQKVTLRLWTYYEATSRASAFPALIKKYEQANPGVTIDLNAGFQNFSPTVQTAMLGGDPPEIIGGTQYLMLQFERGGLLQDLSGAAKQLDIQKLMYPAAVAGVTLSGKIWGFPDALRFGMWFYNTQAFKSLGLTAPTTYDDLKAVSKTIRGAKKFPIIWGLKDLGQADTSLEVIIPAVVGTTAIVDASNAKNYNQPKFVAVFEKYRQMVDDGIIDSSDTGILKTDALTMLGKGDSVMYPSASFDIGNVLALKAGIDAFKQPVKLVDNPVATYYGGIGQCYTVPKANKYFDATTKLLLWWFQPDQIKVQIEQSGLVSSEPEANQAITGPLATFAVQNLDKVQPEGLFWVNYIPTDESTAWEKEVQAVVSKQKTPQEAIQAVQAVFKQ